MIFDNGNANLPSTWRYLYFYEKGNPQITVAAIQSLIELITTEMQSDNSPPDPAADAFLASTLRYLQFQKQKGGAISEKYEAIKVWNNDRMPRTTFNVIGLNVTAVDIFVEWAAYLAFLVVWGAWCV